MFEKIFIEQHIHDHPRTRHILQKLGRFQIPTQIIPKVEDVFGKVKKPYLHKRTNLNLFIGRKKGTLLKEAPDAYGTLGDPHYYFIHAYNCLYECEYCYLQGYFSSPDLVLFINHEEIGEEIRKIALATPSHHTPWFHAGEFSDSLALSHLSNEWAYYFGLFQTLPQARLELRTKSSNIRSILELSPLPNVVVSFSLSPANQSRAFDHKAAPLMARLLAMEKLAVRNFPLAIHLDPIIYTENFLQEYRQLFRQLQERIDLSLLQYISLGVVRFTKDVFHQVEKNYPQSRLLTEEFIKSFDQKIRYPRPLRYKILNSLRKMLLEQGIDATKVYLCMEQ